jgi:hypothetical protein
VKVTAENWQLSPKPSMKLAKMQTGDRPVAIPVDDARFNDFPEHHLHFEPHSVIQHELSALLPPKPGPNALV